MSGVVSLTVLAICSFGSTMEMVGSAGAFSVCAPVVPCVKSSSVSFVRVTPCTLPARSAARVVSTMVKVSFAALPSLRFVSEPRLKATCVPLFTSPVMVGAGRTKGVIAEPVKSRLAERYSSPTGSRSRTLTFCVTPSGSVTTMR